MPDFDSLVQRLRKATREVTEQEAEVRTYRIRHADLEREIAQLTQSLEIYDKATALLTSLGEERQFAAQEAIEQLVTRGLQRIFDETLSFHIIQDVKARRAEVNFVVRSNLSSGRVVETDVMDARGGGLAATVGFLLRLVILLLRDDAKKDNLLVLDETFAHVSDEYLPPLGEFLREIVDKTGVQILMVTHQPEFTEYADVVYRFTAKDGKTLVQKEK